MNRLVRDLLQLSQVEANERVRPRDTVAIRPLLEGVIASLRTVAEKTGDTVVLSGDGATVPGDADQLTQVFTNLVENALKYGALGQEVRVTLTLEDSMRGPAIRVEVADRDEVAGGVDHHELRHRTVGSQPRRDHPVQAQVLRPIGAHLAHAATQHPYSITACPTSTPVAPSPSSSTTPAGSCPNVIGIG